MSCLTEYCNRVKSCIEGNYTTWTQIGSPINIGATPANYLLFSGTTLMYQISGNIYVVDLTNFGITNFSGVLHTNSSFNSALNGYILIPKTSFEVDVYKNGAFDFAITISDVTYTDIWSSCISSDGLYVCITAVDGSGNHWLLVYQGS